MTAYRDSYKGLATEQTLNELVGVLTGTSTLSTTVDFEIKNDAGNPVPISMNAITDGTQKSQIVDSAEISSDQIIRTFNIQFTRPANADPYLLGDTIGPAVAALLSFEDVAKAAGYGVLLLNLRAQTDDTGLEGKAINVHFYNDTVTAIADNEPFVYGDPAKREGEIMLVFGSGTSKSVAADNYLNLSLNPVGRDVYVQIVAPAFTPSANSTTIRLFAKFLLTN